MASAVRGSGQALDNFRDGVTSASEIETLRRELAEARTELTAARREQAAAADVLRIVSRSGADAAPVFDAILEACQRLFGPYGAAIYLVDGDMAKGAAGRGFADGDWGTDATPLAGSSTGRAIAARRPVHIADLAEVAGLPEHKRAAVRAYGGLTTLYAPMISGERGVGSLVVARRPKRPFSEAEIASLSAFADQAVIAIENARLFGEVQARTRELEQSLADLRKAQDRLVQSEKLASLGQLTAGIAHEIKNPLNFVNNFAALSRDLIAEMREALARGETSDVEELTGLIDSNLEKVVHHGRRADSIVKNMLLHSREGSGERALVNVNGMVEEALNLAYHGARAEKPGFNVTIEKALDPECGEADLYLQEVTRALLNLIANSFYATAKRRETEGPDYQPTLKASTRLVGDRVEIRIRDNGAGVPDDVRAKMFNPFFTTKPAGEGTGLGLSLTHDIVVKQHGGMIEVETASGAFTEFIVTLPKGGAGS
ncbi:MAG: GAF domain-containing protein [Pseudomonadota bacterium]|nr:GAF domain-containing protein [Pseudomonadota bacterium]